MVAVAGDGVKQFVIGVVTQVSKRWEVGWHKTTTISTADEPFRSLEIGSTSESPSSTGGICQLSDDDRSVNCLHAVSTQDSESVQSLRARSDDSMNMLSDRKTVRKGHYEYFYDSHSTIMSVIYLLTRCGWDISEAVLHRRIVR